jgi:phosphate butyryltransferase
MTFEEITEIRPTTVGPAVAIAGADDDAILGAVASGLSSGVKFYLVGDPESIRQTAETNGVDLGAAIIVDSGNSDEASICRTAAGLCAEGTAGVLMKGFVGTAAFTRAILDRSAGLTEEGALLSHTGLFSDPRNRQLFLLSDAAINIDPDIETKKKILANAIYVARSLGIETPRIALLAPVEKVSPKIKSTFESAELKIWLNSGALGNVEADGPFALDAAASTEAAKIKGISGPVPGRVDIYLAPNLDAGNILYKALTVFAAAKSAGILAGARVPVVLTSRADSEEVKIASLGLALRVASA